MGQLWKRHKVYAAWDYDIEEEDLNEYSKKGWQLLNGGCFTSTFEKDNTVRYMYQLDYNNKIENMFRYKDTFEEQGWIYINSTFNGWHYFRKPYKEGMSEDEYKIYTDKESLREMQKRWIRIANIVSILNCVIIIMYVLHFIENRDFSWLMGILMYGLILIMFRLGVRKLNKKLEAKSRRFRNI
jgi:uncharacterized membrane protein